MRGIIASMIAILLLALAVSAGPSGVSRVAILDLRNPAELTDQEADYIADLVRGEARKALPPDRYILMTKENIYELLPPDKQSLADCVGECEVQTGRMVGAHYLVTGEVIRFGPELRVRQPPGQPARQRQGRFGTGGAPGAGSGCPVDRTSWGKTGRSSS